MGAWVAFLGSEDSCQKIERLGGVSERRIVDDIGVAVLKSSGVESSLTSNPDGSTMVSIGSCSDAGCSAIVDPSGKSLTLNSDPFGLHTIFTTRIRGEFWCSSSADILYQVMGGEESQGEGAGALGRRAHQSDVDRQVVDGARGTPYAASAVGVRKLQPG